MDLVEFAGIALQIVQYLLYAAIVVQFLAQPDNSSRFRFLLIVLGMFFVLWLAQGVSSSFFHSPQWPFMFTQMVLISLLVFAGVPLMISKEMVVVLFLVFVIGLNSSIGIAWFIGVLAYLIVAFGFLYSTLQILRRGTKGVIG